MGHLSDLEVRHLEQIPSVDIDQVGKEIGRGAQNIVHSYGDNADEKEVIKIPRASTQTDVLSQLVSPLITQTADEMERDMELCEKHFPEFVIPASIQRNPKGEQYCIIQPRIPITELTKKHCVQSPDLRNELAELMAANRKLMDEKGLWLDVMGWDAEKVIGLKPYVSNVVISPSKERKRQLAVFDFGLYKNKGWSFRAMYHRCLLQVQQSNMRRFHGTLSPRFSTT